MQPGVPFCLGGRVSKLLGGHCYLDPEGLQPLTRRGAALHGAPTRPAHLNHRQMLPVVTLGYLRNEDKKDYTWANLSPCARPLFLTPLGETPHCIRGCSQPHLPPTSLNNQFSLTGAPQSPLVAELWLDRAEQSLGRCIAGSSWDLNGHSDTGRWHRKLLHPLCHDTGPCRSSPDGQPTSGLLCPAVLGALVHERPRESLPSLLCVCTRLWNCCVSDMSYFWCLEASPLFSMAVAPVCIPTANFSTSWPAWFVLRAVVFGVCFWF